MSTAQHPDPAPSTLTRLHACLAEVLPQLPSMPQDISSLPAREEAEADFFTRGIIDSMRLLDVVAAIEETFAVSFAPGDLTAANFASLTQMARTIERLRDRR